MQVKPEPIYPACPTITRTVSVGGVTKAELLGELQRNAISMLFTTAAARSSVTTVELRVRDLGFRHGATIAEITTSAHALGLGLCPLELGPHLRLQYRDQPEGYWGQPIRSHQAPSGAVTIASAHLTDDDDVPKGFYLRRIKGVLWLRGYRSWPGHVWESDDRFVFCHTEQTP
jgi:hypothetical protein